MNIKFNYLYRDAGNYKNFAEVVFPNPKGIDLDTVESYIRNCLIDSQFFIARSIGLSELFFDSKNCDDHYWHEFLKVEYTEENVSDVYNRDILNFVNDIKVWFDSYFANNVIAK